MNRDNPYFNKKSSMKSVRYRRTDRDREEISEVSPYVHMFRQDFQTGIVPIGRETIGKLDVRIEPHSKDVENIVTLALPTRHSYCRNLAEKVCGFIEYTTSYLLYYGKAHYEIVYYFDENEANTIGFEYYPIFHDNIHSFDGLYWQYVPKNIIGERGDYPKKLIRLPKDDLFVVSFPKALGGKRDLWKRLLNLQWLGLCTAPEFALKDLEVNTPSKGYDFEKYRYNSDIYLAKTTRKYGWMARGTFRDRCLEFYEIYRHLVFEKNKSILREHILSELNKCLARVGKKMNFNAKISFKGMLSSDEIDLRIERLREGSLQFGEALDYMKCIA